MKRKFTDETGLLIGRIIKWFSLISIIITIFYVYPRASNIAIGLILLTLFSLLNDYIRVKWKKMHVALWYVSFITSNVLAGFLLFKVYCIGTQIYIIILLVEIIVSTQKIPVYVLCLHFIIFTASLIADHTTIKDIFSSYLIIIAIVYLFRNILVEKARTQMLNQELQVANSKLHEYSGQIQELTISKERTRIAQELHDSLGHYLIALNMNLEYANIVVEAEPVKAKIAITKSRELSKECIVNLRKTVVLLGEERTSRDLSQSLHEIFANFQETNLVQFELKMDDDIEFVDSDIKNCIYKTVQEAITNGIKHGKASRFSIEIYKDSEQISLCILNNGAECDEMIKSNGIQGIEDRIKALNGKVDFFSEPVSGFRVEASIPKVIGDFQNE